MLWVIGELPHLRRRQTFPGMIDTNQHRRYHHSLWAQRLFGVRATDSQVRRREKLPGESVPTSKIPGNLGLSYTDDFTWLFLEQLSGFWEIRASCSW